MKNIMCVLGFHDWSEWEYIKRENYYKDILYKQCKRCDKVENYVGLTQKCLTTGKLSPYIFKD